MDNTKNIDAIIPIKQRHKPVIGIALVPLWIS
jgi:hypothetical protein